MASTRPPKREFPESLFTRTTQAALLMVLAGSLAACGERSNDQATATPAQPAIPATPTTPMAPATPTTPVSVSPAAPSTAVVTQALPVKLPLSVQGVAPAGVTVRVKGAEVGGDATVLDVSISFANRITNSTMLALADTYLQDESGAKLHIKRPEGNRDLTIREGQTLDGQLVFLGSVAPSARQLKLVFNDGNEGDNIVAPGLAIDVPLPAAKG